MSGVRCIIEYSEVWSQRCSVGTTEYGACIKATIRNPAIANEIDLLPEATKERIDEIGLRAEMNERDQHFLRRVLLCDIAGLPLED